jgi:hypothetical protein
VQSTPLWVATGMGWDINTPKSRSGYLLPFQELNLNDHATSDIHLLGHFLYGVFLAFTFLSGGQQSIDVMESCCGVAPHLIDFLPTK